MSLNIHNDLQVPSQGAFGSSTQISGILWLCCWPTVVHLQACSHGIFHLLLEDCNQSLKSLTPSLPRMLIKNKLEWMH